MTLLVYMRKWKNWQTKKYSKKLPYFSTLIEKSLIRKQTKIYKLTPYIRNIPNLSNAQKNIGSEIINESEIYDISLSNSPDIYDTGLRALILNRNIFL